MQPTIKSLLLSLKSTLTSTSNINFSQLKQCCICLQSKQNTNICINCNQVVCDGDVKMIKKKIPLKCPICKRCTTFVSVRGLLKRVGEWRESEGEERWEGIEKVAEGWRKAVEQREKVEAEKLREVIAVMEKSIAGLKEKLEMGSEEESNQAENSNPNIPNKPEPNPIKTARNKPKHRGKTVRTTPTKLPPLPEHSHRNNPNLKQQQKQSPEEISPEQQYRSQKKTPFTLSRNKSRNSKVSLILKTNAMDSEQIMKIKKAYRIVRSSNRLA